MKGVVLWLPVLILVYALTLASFAPWDLAIGAVLGVGVMVLFGRSPVTAPTPALRATATQRVPGPNSGERTGEGANSPVRLSAFVWFWPFAAVVTWEIVKGTWQVALVVLGVRPGNRAGMVAVPIGERTPLGVAIFGVATTLSPGSVLVDVDWTEGVMLFHVLDASDPDAVRTQFARLYERWQRRVIP